MSSFAIDGIEVRTVFLFLSTFSSSLDETVEALPVSGHSINNDLNSYFYRRGSKLMVARSIPY